MATEIAQNIEIIALLFRFFYSKQKLDLIYLEIVPNLKWIPSDFIVHVYCN